MPEIKIETTAKGHRFISVTLQQCLDWGGLGICDSCNNMASPGKYVPVLNSYFCEPCFNKWAARATYYPEDRAYESRKLAGMVERLQGN